VHLHYVSCLFSTYHADNEYAILNHMEKGFYGGLLFAYPFFLCQFILLVFTNTIPLLSVLSTYHAQNECVLLNHMQKSFYVGLLFAQPFLSVCVGSSCSCALTLYLSCLCLAPTTRRTSSGNPSTFCSTTWRRDSTLVYCLRSLFFLFVSVPLARVH